MNIKNYFLLMRFHKPIGIFLLLWPTLWALWLAGEEHPDPFIVIVFITGVIVMRAAGCVINDISDRRFDGHVERTRDRPLVSGKVSVKEAFILFLLLLFCAFLLVLTLNKFTLLLAWVGAGLTLFYPLMKRFTHLPQVGLGLAFAWGVPMAFAALTNAIPVSAWVLFLTAAVWPMMYDTLYAMVDREDDINIGIKSTAILFAKYDRLVIALLQVTLIILLAIVGYLFGLHYLYFISLAVVSILFIYQQVLIKKCTRDAYFKAFLNNHWVGFFIFIGMLLGAGL